MMMALPNVFLKETTDQIVERLSHLQHDTKPLWGKMNAPQLLAHLNVTYDLAYERIPLKNNFIMSWMLKTFVKKFVVNEVPYKHNLRTSPVFLIADERDFEKEKQLFIENIMATQEKGYGFFDGKTSVSFGPLSGTEWNNMFYKHIDHHFMQFGI